MFPLPWTRENDTKGDPNFGSYSWLLGKLIGWMNMVDIKKNACNECYQATCLGLLPTIGKSKIETLVHPCTFSTLALYT